MALLEKPKFSTTAPILITTNKPTLIKITINSIEVAEREQIEYYYIVKSDSNISNADYGAAQRLPSNFQIYMEKTKPFLFICAREKAGNRAFSDWSMTQVPVNSAPICKFLYEVDNEVDSIDKEKKYTNQLKNISANLYSAQDPSLKISENILSYNWKVGTVGNYVEKTSISIDEIELPPVDFKINEERNILISLEVKDKYGDTFSFSEKLNYYRFKLQKPKSMVVRPQNEKAFISSEYISNNIKFKVNCPQPIDEPQFTLVFYKGLEKEGKWEYESQPLKDYSVANGLSLYENCVSNVEDNISYKFKAELTILLPAESIILGSIETNEAYILLEQLNPSEFNFNKKEWHPIKDYVDYVIFNTSAEDQLVYFTSTYFNELKYNAALTYYKIEAILNGTTIELVDKISPLIKTNDWITIINGNTIDFGIKNLTLFKKLNVPSNIPTFQVQFKITCYNGFDRPGIPIYCECQVITEERPNIDRCKQQEGDFQVEVNSGVGVASNDNKYSNWINAGDTITFKLNLPPFDYNDYLLIDPNQEDQKNKPTATKYEISYRYKDTEWKKLQSGEYDYSAYFSTSNLIDRNESYLKDSQDDYLVIGTIEKKSSLEFVTIPLPDLSNGILEGTQIEIGLRFIDDRDLASEYLSYTFFACRTAKPVFNIPKATSEDMIDEEGKEFKKITFYFRSIDLGGNNEQAENFRRTGEETYKVTIDYGRENSTNLTNTLTFDSANNSDLVFLNQNEYFEGYRSFDLKEDWNKIYIRATIEITINSETGKSIQTTTAVYLLHLNSPTLSHRSHWIGINNSDNDLNDVFQVSSFQNRKNIKLLGFYREEGTTPKDVWINIDLNQGKIFSSENFELDLFNGILTKRAEENSSMQIDLNSGKILNANIEDSNLIDITISGGTW